MTQNNTLKCKRAYTLIELLIVVSMISLIGSYVLIRITSFSNLINNIDVEKSKNKIMMFINNAKLYCRENETSGTIYFYPGRDKADFNCQGKNVEHFTLPSGFYIYDVNSDYSQITIDSRGFTSDACTISFKDRRGKFHEISIYVGTGYVEVKS